MRIQSERGLRKVITYFPVTEAMGRDECDREFEAGQHQKPKFKVLALGLELVEQKLIHLFHFYRSSYIDELFLFIKLLFDSFKVIRPMRGSRDGRAAPPTF